MLTLDDVVIGGEKQPKPRGLTLDDVQIQGAEPVAERMAPTPPRGLNPAEQAFFADPTNTSLHQRTPGEMLSGPTLTAPAQPEGNLANAFRGMAVNTGVGLDKARINSQAWMGDVLDIVAGREKTAAGDALNQSRMRQYGQAGARAEAARPEYNLGFTNDLYGATTSLAQTAPSMALAIATKNPALGLGVAGMQSADYLKYRGRGASVGEASLGAAGEGAVEILTEASPMGFLIGKYGTKSAKDFLSGFLVREGLGEQAATLAQDAIDTAVANPNKTWAEYLKERPNAAYQTALATLVMGGTVAAPKAAAEVFAGKPQAAPSATPAASAPAVQPKPLASMSLDDVQIRDADATIDPINPQQFGATVETARPQFGAVVETVPPRGIVEYPQKGNADGLPGQSVAEVAPESREGGRDLGAPRLPDDVVQPAGNGMDTAAGMPEPGSGSDPVAGDTSGAGAVDLRDLTEGLIRQMRDAKQMNLDSNLRKAIDRIKAGGVNEKPAYFAKLAKEFEKRGDPKTAGMLGQVAATLKARQKAIPKPAAPAVPKTVKTGVTTADEFSETSRKQFLRMVKQMGGVSTEFAADITGEPANQANRILPGFFSTRGNHLDLIARRLHEAGYLTDAEYDSVDGGVERTRELLGQALAKEFVGTPDQRQTLAELEAREADAAAELQSAQEQAELAEILGQDVTEADFNALFDGVPDAAQDQADLAYTQEQENDAAETSRIESQAGEAVARGAAAREEGGQGQPGRAPVQSENAGQEARPALDLAQQTERDLAERERELNRREAEQNARERAALDKEKADRARDDFTLTGSDRASDANAGQGDLLSASNEEARNDSPVAESQAPDTESGDAGVAPGRPITDGNKQGKAVENFGESLPPARRAMAAKLDESLADGDIAARPLSEIWPQAENDAIEDTFAAAVAHAARAEIPAKPRVGYKVKQWVAKVQGLRELAAKIVSGRVSRDEFINASGAYALRDWIGKVKLLEQLPRDQWKRVETVEERPDAYTYDKDGVQVPTPMLRLVIDGKRHYLRNGGTVSDNMAEIAALLADAAPEKRMEFEIRQPRSGGKFFINKKGDGQYRRLMEFDTAEEARDAIRGQYDALVGEWENVKARDNITERDLRSAENRPRVGKDHRGGRDVTPEEFQTTFGFRGGEFGKWVQQGKGDKNRQAILNSAFDALHDLADIVGVPPAAISLNGTLGIAFGSRGSGWASAHFEPSNLVINLTKTRGAGALAHEWFHAMDNYFSRLRGGEVAMSVAGSQKAYTDQNYITHQPEPLMVRKPDGGRYQYLAPMTLGKLKAMHEANKQDTDAYNPDHWQRDPKHREGVRPEVEQRFAALVEALNESPMTKRARLLDGKKSGDGYWSSTLERAARTFENYVQARMLEDGYHNDFLANVKAADETGKNDARYPYLMPGEIKPIAEAFDALFAEVKTKETDSGIALFARGRPEAARDTGPVSQVELDAVIERVASGWKRAQGDGGRLIAVDTVADLPVAILRAADAQNVPQEEIKGVFHRGHIYLVRENHATAQAVEETIFHEAYGHMGALLLNGNDQQKLSATFNDVWRRIDGLDGVRKMARQFDVLDQVEPYIKSLATAKNMTLETKRRVIVDELLAHVAGRGDFTLKEQAKAYIGALRVGLRNAARAMKLDGIAQTLDAYTDSELLWNLKQMRAAVVSGATGKGNGTLFARRAPAGPNSPQQPINLQNRPGFNIDPETAVEQIQRKHQDRMNRWAKVQRQIKEQGGTVELDQDVYHAMERMTGRAADRIDQFTHETVRPLLKRITDLNTNFEELGTYLMALGAKDRNDYIQTIRQDMPDNGSGLSNQEAAQIIADYRKRPDFAKFDALARDFQKLTERKLKVLVGGGVISQQQATDLTQAFGFYVPFKGFETIDEDGNRAGGTGAGYSTPKRFTKQAFGRVSKAGQVVENIIRDYEQAVILAEKANVGRYVRNLAQANPDPTLWTVDQPPSQPSLVNGHVQLRQATFDNENEIRFIEGGKEVRIQLHDPLLAQTYNNLGQEPLSFLMKAGDTLNRFLRQTYTQKNPAFILVNGVRDVQTGLALMTAEMGATAAGKAMRHMAGAFKAAGRESRKRGSVTGEWAKYMDAYRKSGAQTAYYAIEDIEAKQAKLHELMAREGGGGFLWAWKQHGVKGLGKMALYRSYNNAVVDVIESLNGGFENMMRLSAFRQYIDDHGGIDNPSRETLAEASRIAKNLTVNFNRKGEKTRGLNALYLFWNANVQGTQNLYRAAMSSAHKGQVRAAIGGMVGLGFLMAMATDEEDDELTPGYLKDTSIVIHIGDGKRIQIPLAYGLGAFVAMGYEMGMLTKGARTPARSAMNLLATTLQHFSPLGNPIHDGEADMKDLAVAGMPTILKVPTMLATNRNGMGYDVVPKFDDEQPDRPAMRNATRGGVFDKAAGGLEYVGLDVSPESLKLTSNFLTGGLGTFLSDSATALMVGAKGEFDGEKTPILKRFYGENDVEEYRSRFYEQANDVKQQASAQGKKQNAFFGSNRARDSVVDYTKQMKELRARESAAQDAGNHDAAERIQAKQIKLSDAFKKEHDRMVKRGLIEQR